MIASIGRRRTFAELRTDGRRVRHGSVRLSFLPLPTEEPQVAFALGRRFGNAVERNRARRRLRAAFVEAFDRRVETAEHPELLGAYLLSGDRGLLTAGYRRLVSDVDACLSKLTATLVS